MIARCEYQPELSSKYFSEWHTIISKVNLTTCPSVHLIHIKTSRL